MADAPLRLRRLLCGGSWLYHPRYCRPAYRINAQPDDADDDIGFRVVCLSQSDHTIQLEEQADG